MATYIRLTDYKDSDSKEQGFFKSENRYEAKQDDFVKIPGSPIAYWLSEQASKVINLNQSIGELLTFKQGIATSDNERFLRYWNEVEFNKVNFLCQNPQDLKESILKWFPYNKGGAFQKWYGNNEYIVNWENDGKEMKDFTSTLPQGMNVRLKSREFYCLPNITYSSLSSGDFGCRYSKSGFLFDTKGSCIFSNESSFNYYIALLNSKVSKLYLDVLCPTLDYNMVGVKQIPTIFPQQESVKQQIDILTQECIDISKEDWDSKETSWDFTKNELLKHKSDNKIETAYNNYCSYWKEKFYKLHANEEELNRLFIDIYELNDELTPDVALKDITILKSESIINEDKNIEFKADEIMKQFISYAVGVMFGRYSIDSDGLVVANLNQDYPKDATFEIDDDNVIPVLEDDYFSDDIASRIINFVKTTFGAENLSENINFIEKCLGKTIRAYMVKDFYEDHIKRYKKRPIYWMVSSPKKGFMSLSYMHRYTTDLFARVQNNYLREYITKLEGTIEVQKQTILNEMASNKDKTDADKRIKAIDTKLKELISFDRDNLTSYAQNRVDIDLDDGVKVNYNKFKEVLYPIKGLDKE